MADIALAAVPIGAKLVLGCLDAYTLFTQAKTLGSGSQSLLWKFKIQHARLQIWANEWGLLAGPTPQPSRDEDEGDNQLVIETLIRISEILKDYKGLKKRYGLSLVSDDPKYRVSVSVIACHLPLCA
jgi:hypothetical protein